MGRDLRGLANVSWAQKCRVLVQKRTYRAPPPSQKRTPGFRKRTWLGLYLRIASEFLKRESEEAPFRACRGR
eukprot:2792573-Rhodomonas_salina.2